GEIRVRQLVLRPEDVEVIAPKSPLAAAVRGEADLKSDGKTAGVDVRLEAGGGKIGAKLTATLEKVPGWDVQLSLDAVDPDALSLDLDVRAPDLAHFGRAVGATLRQPSLPIGGAARLAARVTGSPASPDASLSLRARKFLWGGTISADDLAVNGTLHGPLKRPDGSLRLSAQRLSASAIDLGAPRVDMTLQWPLARLRIDAAVAGGAFQLAGDAKINDDKDGLTLSNFLV